MNLKNIVKKNICRNYSKLKIEDLNLQPKRGPFLLQLMTFINLDLSEFKLPNPIFRTSSPCQVAWSRFFGKARRFPPQKRKRWSRKDCLGFNHDFFSGRQRLLWMEMPVKQTATCPPPKKNEWFGSSDRFASFLGQFGPGFSDVFATDFRDFYGCKGVSPPIIWKTCASQNWESFSPQKSEVITTNPHSKWREFLFKRNLIWNHHEDDILQAQRSWKYSKTIRNIRTSSLFAQLLSFCSAVTVIENHFIIGPDS